MKPASRRAFLTGTAGLVGGLASARAGVASASARSARFIVDATTVSVRQVRASELELVYELAPIDRLVVEGAERTLERLTDAYVEDVRIVRDHSGVPSMDAAARDAVREALGQPAETTSELYAAQWDKQVQDILTVHEVTRGDGTSVAIIDSGVHADHPGVSHAFDAERSRSFVNDGYGAGLAIGGAVPYHGTVCAGVVAANGDLLLGSAPATEIVDCRVFPAAEGDPSLGASTADFLAAIVHAVEVGCDVANLSLGPGVSLPVQYSLFDQLASTRIVDYANENGLLVVVAAGNEALDLRRFPQRSFAPQPGLMVVSATGPIGFGWPTTDLDDDDFTDVPRELEDSIQLEAPYHEPAAYTNYGEGIISVSAPGGNYDSVAQARDTFGWRLDMLPIEYVVVEYDSETGYQFENTYWWGRGTSYAAPQVAGAAALVSSVDPEAPPEAVQQRLERTATDVGRMNPDPYHGAGFLNPYAAVQSRE